MKLIVFYLIEFDLKVKTAVSTNERLQQVLVVPKLYWMSSKIRMWLKLCARIEIKIYMVEDIYNVRPCLSQF